MPRKSASGSGTIRKVTKIQRGKEYTYWEGRYTDGTDPGTGKQRQKSIYGKSEREVAKKLREITSKIDSGTFLDASNMTLGKWLDTWLDTYLVKQKDSTKSKYKSDCTLHIKPALGAVKLKNLNTEQIQLFYNGLNMSAKSVRNIHGTLHKALEQARKLRYIQSNPSDDCELRTPDKHEVTPLTSEEVVRYIHAAEKDEIGSMLTVLAFTGMRRCELIGLPWKCVDFKNGCITVKQQLKQVKGGHQVVATKENDIRKIYPAKIAMDALKKERDRQRKWEKDNKEIFENKWGLCFTDATGHFVSKDKLRNHHMKVLQAAGIEHHRIHDMRDTFAVTSLQAGDDIKTVQENLGHADPAFTLKVYTASLDEMKKRSSTRMQAFFEETEKADKGKQKGNQE